MDRLNFFFDMATAVSRQTTEDIVGKLQEALKAGFTPFELFEQLMMDFSEQFSSTELATGLILVYLQLAQHPTGDTLAEFEKDLSN